MVIQEAPRNGADGGFSPLTPRVHEVFPAGKTPEQPQLLVSERLKEMLRNREWEGNGPRILLIGGVTGSGKTRVAQKLSRDLECLYIPEFFDKLPDFIAKTNSPETDTDSERQAQQWVLDQYKQKAVIARTLTAGVCVVQDRGPLGCLAYASVSTQELFEEVRDELETVDWPQAYSVILTANEETLRRRLSYRRPIPFSDEEWADNRPFIIGLQQNYTRVAIEIGLPIIDTSRLQTHETTRKILTLPGVSEYMDLPRR